MEAVRQSSPCLAYVDFLSLCAGYVIDDICGDAFKIRLDSRILTVLEIKGQFLHRVHLRVKIPGWLSNLNALLIKKLPKFFSRLNEMSGDRENIFLASGSLRITCNFFRMTLTNEFSHVSLQINISKPCHG